MGELYREGGYLAPRGVEMGRRRNRLAFKLQGVNFVHNSVMPLLYIESNTRDSTRTISNTVQ